MNDQKYDALKLENQLCFPLYAASREVIKKYKPFLDELDLTYTQYITMMILWDKHAATAKELGDLLYLDSGTLTPLLKKLESKGLVSRKRSDEDERNLVVTLTESGAALRDEALHVPGEMAKCVILDTKEVKQLYDLLYKLLEK